MAGFTLIEDTVLGSAAASITFSDLSAYTKFRLTLYVIKDGNVGGASLQFNGDTGTNYAYEFLLASSTSATAARLTAQTSILAVNAMSANGTAVATVEVSKPLTTTPARMTNAASRISTDVALWTTAGEWNNTAALISSISILSSSGNFAAGTRALLEGAA